jgi:hypothetical protein
VTENKDRLDTLLLLTRKINARYALSLKKQVFIRHMTIAINQENTMLEPKRFILTLLIGVFLACGWAHAEDYNGTFLITGSDGTITLTLLQDESGDVSGKMSDGFTSLTLEGELVPPGISGDATSDDGQEMGFAAKFEADCNLYLKIFPYDESDNPNYSAAKTLIFARQGTAPAGQTGQTARGAAASGGEVATTREVYINRVKLDNATLQALETQYRIPIQNGRFWYDANCGAWGVEGGPTAGFIYPALNLPGPMPVDISRGGTGIFINGREIHPLDQMALQQIFGSTIPGRYWLDAQGNLGPVGGGAIANLAAAIATSRGGKSGSVTHGYGKGYGSRGTVGGGMYSGRTATGKSVLWYPGM